MLCATSVSNSRYAVKDCMLSCDLIDTKALRHECLRRRRGSQRKLFLVFLWALVTLCPLWVFKFAAKVSVFGSWVTSVSEKNWERTKAAFVTLSGEDFSMSAIPSTYTPRWNRGCTYLFLWLAAPQPQYETCNDVSNEKTEHTRQNVQPIERVGDIGENARSGKKLSEFQAESKCANEQCQLKERQLSEPTRIWQHQEQQARRTKYTRSNSDEEAFFTGIRKSNCFCKDEKKEAAYAHPSK